MIGVVVAFGVIGLVVLMGGVIVSRRASRSLIEERLGLSEKELAVQKAGAPGARKTPLGDALNRMLTSRGIGADLATQLARADLKFTVGEFMAANLILVIALGGLAFFIKKGDLIATALGCLAGFFGPRIYLTFQRNRRLQNFNNQLGDTINLMVNGIRAGYSVMQAMEAVSKEMGPPISVEFGRVVKEVQLGLTLEQSLANMLRRITSDDLDMMVTAINVQREVGGNLAEVLDAISYTIRERVRIKGEIRALTSYGRGAGNMLSAIPVILALVIYLINPDFMSQLFTDRCGWVLLGVAILGIVVGYLVIRRIVNIDV